MIMHAGIRTIEGEEVQCSLVSIGGLWRLRLTPLRGPVLFFDSGALRGAVDFLDDHVREMEHKEYRKEILGCMRNIVVG